VYLHEGESKVNRYCKYHQKSIGDMQPNIQQEPKIDVNWQFSPLRLHAACNWLEVLQYELFRSGIPTF
jgi:hypothetical protein